MLLSVTGNILHNSINSWYSLSNLNEELINGKLNACIIVPCIRYFSIREWGNRTASPSNVKWIKWLFFFLPFFPFPLTLIVRYYCIYISIAISDKLHTFACEFQASFCPITIVHNWMQIAFGGQNNNGKAKTHTHKNSNLCFISNSEIHAIKYKVVWQVRAVYFFSCFLVCNPLKQIALEQGL